MNESAEDVAAVKAAERNGRSDVRRRVIRRPETETAMGPAAVVVADEDLQHLFEMATFDDEQMVETLPANGADPSLRETRWPPESARVCG